MGSTLLTPLTYKGKVIGNRMPSIPSSFKLGFMSLLAPHWEQNRTREQKKYETQGTRTNVPDRSRSQAADGVDLMRH